MTSRSLRVSEALFEAASQAGKALTRSTAQQVEHWARLGRALEGAGLTVDEAMRMFTLAAPESEASMWKAKRARQAADIEKLASGQVAQADMLLFTEAQARGAKILNGPY